MMNKTKIIFSAILLSALTACNSSSVSGTNNTSNTNSSNTTSNATTTNDTSSSATNSTNIPIISSNNKTGCEPDEELKQLMLTLVNQARAQDRSCGGQLYNATTPLSWNPRLATAAKKHSIDMASNNYFSHTGLNGSTVSDRVQDEGYFWIALAENIFAGAKKSADAIDGWLESAGHCRNIMNSALTEIGAACAENMSSTFGRYHTQVFGSQ